MVMLTNFLSTFIIQQLLCKWGEFMKVKVIKAFIDIHTNEYQKEGKVMDISDERFKEIASHKIKYVKPIEKENTKKGDTK